MSGPALNNRTSHTAIHDATRSELEEAIEILQSDYNPGDEKRKEAAISLVELWDTKVLNHAIEEEEGLYIDLRAKNPGLQPILEQLSRDHEILKLMRDKLMEMIESNSTVAEIVGANRVMLELLYRHSKDEEGKLF